MNYFVEAKKKLDTEIKKVTGNKEGAMKKAVYDALICFCDMDEEFAQGVAQGGSFEDCMKAVAKNVGNSISDLDAYKKAVQFYFPGAGVSFQMKIDLCASVKEDAQCAPLQAEKGKDAPCAPLQAEREEEQKKCKIINLEDFF